MAIRFDDASSRTAFSNRLVIKHLARGFLVEGHGISWTQGGKLGEDFDFEKMELVPGEHIDKETFRELRQDVVWRLPRREARDGEDLFIVVMVELQSTVDPTMASRIRQYVDMIYRDHFKDEKKSAAVGPPPVLPIVVYTGKSPWRAATSLAEFVN